MTVVNKGFHGRRDDSARQLPPGQHLTSDFPVLQAGPTPRIDLDDWRFTIRDERGGEYMWTWSQLKTLPSEHFTIDIHCVTTWSKLDTEWEGVSLDTLFESVDTTAEFALIGSYGGYTTNIPVADLLGGKAWVVGLTVPGWGGHLAGQHVDLKLTAEDGYSAQRSYSLASPPEGERIELTVLRP